MSVRRHWRRFGGPALAAAAALALVFAACGGDDDDGGDDNGGNGGAPTSAAASPTTETGASPTTEAASTPAAVDGVTISTAEGPEGPILVDADGLTLYTFDNDVAGSGASACTGGCLQAWPPATVAAASATPTAGDDVTGELGTITRDDGTIQVTYKGKPLYRFVNDAAPGDTNGASVPNWAIAVP
jgi:predicted lipoprotein with Yx(FWY)xxD motif